MNLQRKIFLGIEQLRQDWKTWCVYDVAKDLFAVFAPEIVQGQAAKSAAIWLSLSFAFLPRNR